MAWPKKLASKIISGFIGIKYDLIPSDIRRFNPPMGAMPFFNNSASPDIRRAELQLFAGKLLKFLTELDIPLENGKRTSEALKALVDAMVVESAPSSHIVDTVDAHYHFRDEDDE